MNMPVKLGRWHSTISERRLLNVLIGEVGGAFGAVVVVAAAAAGAGAPRFLRVFFFGAALAFGFGVGAFLGAGLFFLDFFALANWKFTHRHKRAFRYHTVRHNTMATRTR